MTITCPYIYEQRANHPLKGQKDAHPLREGLKDSTSVISIRHYTMLLINKDDMLSIKIGIYRGFIFASFNVISHSHRHALFAHRVKVGRQAFKKDKSRWDTHNREA